MKKGKKRKSEGASDVEKRPKMEDEDGQGPGPGTGPEGLGIL